MVILTGKYYVILGDQWNINSVSVLIFKVCDFHFLGGGIMKHIFKLILNPVNIFIIHFRSPWSNTYDPPLEDGAVPSEKLRKLEQEANVAFDQYREM